MKRIITTAFFLVLGTPAAVAQPTYWYESDSALHSVAVYTGDLRLSDQRDRDEAASRIEHAANVACAPFPDLHALDEVRDYRDCRDEAFDAALSELEHRTAQQHRRGHVYTHEYPGGSHH